MSIRLVLVLTVLAACAAVPAAGQEADSVRATAGEAGPDDAAARSAGDRPRPPIGTSGLDVWGGWSAVTGQVVGKTPKSSFTIGGVRYRRPVASLFGGAATLAYTGGLVHARLGIPRSARPLLPDSTFQPNSLDVRGIGATPVGLELAARPASRVRPFASASGGFLYFFEPVPDRQGKNVNFTLSVGVGVRVRVFRASHLTLGYRYHHTSNGFRGQVNPGVDSNLFYAGVTLFPGLLP